MIEEISKQQDNLRDLLEGFLFKFNDDTTRSAVESLLNKNGVKAICNEYNNPFLVIAANLLIVDLPNLSLRVILGREEVEFDDIPV